MSHCHWNAENGHGRLDVLQSVISPVPVGRWDSRNGSIVSSLIRAWENGTHCLDVGIHSFLTDKVIQGNEKTMKFPPLKFLGFEVISDMVLSYSCLESDG